MKICSNCKEEKSLDAFHNNRSMPDGKQYHCKECRAERARIDSAKNVERIRKWREENPERAKLAAQKHYEENKDAYIAKAKTWREENLDRYREIKRLSEGSRRAAAKRTAWETIQLEDILAAYTVDGQLICNLCFEVVEENDLEIDHIIPLSKGGEHIFDNLAVTHGYCNRRKHNKIIPAGSFQRGD